MVHMSAISEFGEDPLLLPGYDLDSNATARVTAILDALGMYAQSLPDIRRTIVGKRTEVETANLDPVDPAQIAGWMGSGCVGSSKREPWSVAHSVLNGAVRAVPTSATFVKSHLNAGCYEETDAGVGVGFGTHAALQDAILSLLSSHTLRRAALGQIDFVAANLQSWAATNKDVDYLLKSLEHLEQAVMVFLLTHDSATVALALDPNKEIDLNRVIVRSALTPRDAVVLALTQFLALSIGAPSRHTAERYLPGSLGYAPKLKAASEKIACVDEVGATLSTPSQMVAAFGDRVVDILVVDITPKDLSEFGVAVMKAIALTDIKAPST